MYDSLLEELGNLGSIIIVRDIMDGTGYCTKMNISRVEVYDNEITILNDDNGMFSIPYGNYEVFYIEEDNEYIINYDSFVYHLTFI